MGGRIIYPVNILRGKIFTAHIMYTGIYTRIHDMCLAEQVITPFIMEKFPQNHFYNQDNNYQAVS